MRQVNGLVKFCLLKMEPDFSLYMTPIQIDPQDPCFPISQPEEYAAELAARFGPYYTLGIPEDTKALTEGRLTEEGFLEMCDQIVTEQEAMLAYELERFKDTGSWPLSFLPQTGYSTSSGRAWTRPIRPLMQKPQRDIRIS